MIVSLVEFGIYWQSSKYYKLIQNQNALMKIENLFQNFKRIENINLYPLVYTLSISIYIT